mmetsp:Transcript_4370/g.15517  ORF Transcript_4370/g.15517 Transcript_4370/m.15517 type:complete len:104 (+) Transcript_4370:3-314(+)
MTQGYPNARWVRGNQHQTSRPTGGARVTSMGCCFSHAKQVVEEEDYEEKREKILAAAKNRETEYDRRGINNPRAAARLKKEKTTKPSVDHPRSSEPGLQWRIG